MTPAWLLDVVAGLMLVVAGVSSARLVVARPWRPDAVIIDTDIAHLLMAIAMAGMLATSLRTFPDAVWEVIFGALMAWFALRVVRDARANGIRALAGGHCAPHLVHSASMLYMFLAVAPVAGMAGMGSMGGMSGASMEMLRRPTLAFVFALILIGYTVWDLDQLSGRRYRPTGASTALATIAVGGLPAMAGVESAAAIRAFSGTQRGGTTEELTLRSGTDRPAVGRSGDFLLSTAVTVGCRIAMGVAMAFLLLIMI
jgi:Domain of unknown function (DUF5134)